MLQAALKVPNQQIRDARDALAKGLPPKFPKLHRLLDGEGLYLLIAVKGVSHAWRFDYTFRGLEKTLSLGVYPKVGLADARRKAEEFRVLVAAGVNPSDLRKSEKGKVQQELRLRKLLATGQPLPGTFEEIARRWSMTVHVKAVSAGHAATTLRRLELNLFPWLGARLIGTIEPPEVLTCLRRIETRGNSDTAHRTMNACGQVFRFGISEGACTRDPTADLRDALAPVNSKVHAAITDPKELQVLLKAMDVYTGGLVTKTALRLSAHLFQRPGEIRQMEWAEVDLTRELWTVPSERMKRTKDGKANGPPHLVPLSKQSVALLRELHPVNGGGRFVFPSVRTAARPMSDGTVISALKTMGYSADVMTAHGFRATARTILAEVLDIEAQVIEAQLAHLVTDPNGDSYNRASWVARRREMMQTWSDFLDEVRKGKFTLKKAEPALSARLPNGLSRIPAFESDEELMNRHFAALAAQKQADE